MKLSTIVTAIIAVIGAYALSVVTQIFQPSEKVNALWLVIAAACFFVISYRLYGSFITGRVLALDNRRLTPAKRMADGRDYHPTHKWVLFGHHFAAIAGAGPLIGPVLAAQFGYLPGFLWILIGAALGAVSLAVGMASIFSNLPGMKGLMPYWYNFALMFEALFILTTVDTGTRVARFIVQELGGYVYKPLSQTNWMPGTIITSFLVVGSWAFLIYSGSISTIWPMLYVYNDHDCFL